MDSLDRLLAVVENERAQQINHFDAIDAKAGVILGFAGALVALVPDVALFFLIPGAVLAGSAALAALSCFYPQGIAARIQPRQLRDKYLTADERFTALTLLDTQVFMIEQSGRILQGKTRRLQAAMALLAAAVAVLGLGILVAGAQGANR